MHNTVNSLVAIKEEIQLKIIDKTKIIKTPQIIAVSKTFKMEYILPLINYGHVHFGENKIQEAIKKWTEIKYKNQSIKLHFIGKLQSNKVRQAISLFDYIHSLDNLKLAEKISNEQVKQNKKIKLFIQVNIGEEIQKSGVKLSNLDKFYKTCIYDLGLSIIGFMCLPPNDGNVSSYFSQMKSLKNNFNLEELSMGMSNDYMEAVNFDSTYLRIGSKIFGQRTSLS
jgi:PLP dependent protein